MLGWKAELVRVLYFLFENRILQRLVEVDRSQ